MGWGVTHNVSVIAVQAGAARRISASDAERALAVLATIEETARGTLTELRALLGVLRKGSDEPSALRQPVRH
jgi:signal transduction histidine kinase